MEDNKWGDLVLVADDKSFAFVVECKINADLEKHQDPSDDSNEFWDVGYGREITERFS